MNKTKKVTKKQLVEDLEKIQNLWSEKHDGIITRDFYRSNGKYKESQINKVFGSFKEVRKILKVEEKEKITRESFNIKKVNKNYNKRYFVTAIIPNAKINEKFANSIETYCKHNNAELLLMVMRGVNVDDEFSSEVLEKYQKHFITEFIFNDKLISKDFLINPSQIIPLTGLVRYGGGSQSLLIASPKQSLVTIPKQINEFPHIVFSTGTFCEPQYKNNRQGQIAKEDNCLSGWIIEIKNNKTFFVRAVQFDGKGFQDLSKYYTADNVMDKNANSIVIEPHFGVEDNNALNFVDEVIKECKPQNIIMHDTYDGGAINPHMLNNIGAKCIRNSIQQTLKSELDYLGYKLQELENKYDMNFLHVFSNHNQFLNRYLETGEFIKDVHNVKLGAELFLAMVNDNDPLEYYLNKNFKLKKQKFLKVGESYKICNVEVNTHGNRGANGSRGNIKGIEASISDAIIGHSHVYSVYRLIVSTPTVCQLQQNYNKDGTSSWLTGCCLLFSNGKKQVILDIYDEWRL
jgi:hypothetical protein